MKYAQRLGQFVRFSHDAQSWQWQPRAKMNEHISPDFKIWRHHSGAVPLSSTHSFELPVMPSEYVYWWSATCPVSDKFNPLPFSPVLHNSLINRSWFNESSSTHLTFSDRVHTLSPLHLPYFKISRNADMTEYDVNSLNTYLTAKIKVNIGQKITPIHTQLAV